MAKKTKLELQTQTAELVSRAVVNRDREPGLLLNQFPCPVQRLVFGAEALRADPIVEMRIAARHGGRIPIANTINHRLTPFCPCEKRRNRQSESSPLDWPFNVLDGALMVADTRPG
jgi:hypothetical protein